MIISVSHAGLTMGIAIAQKILSSVAPSILALSSISSVMFDSMNCFIRYSPRVVPHAGMMIAYASAIGQLPNVVRIELRDVPESFQMEDRTLRAPVFLFGMLKRFDLPQLYQAARHFNPQAVIQIHYKNQQYPAQ